MAFAYAGSDFCKHFVLLLRENNKAKNEINSYTLVLGQTRWRWQQEVVLFFGVLMFSYFKTHFFSMKHISSQKSIRFFIENGAVIYFQYRKSIQEIYICKNILSNYAHKANVMFLYICAFLYAC